MLVRRRYDMTYVQRLSANGNRVPFAGGAQPNTSRQPSPPGSVLDGTAYTKVVSSMPRAPHTALLPIIALCAGLIGLAVLEYRWTAEIARAERDRLRAGMRAAAARFVDDLRRELVGLLPALRPVPFSVHDDAARYARQVEEWAAYLEAARARRVCCGRVDGRAAADPRPPRGAGRTGPASSAFAFRARRPRARGQLTRACAPAAAWCDRGRIRQADNPLLGPAGSAGAEPGLDFGPRPGSAPRPSPSCSCRASLCWPGMRPRGRFERGSWPRDLDFAFRVPR